MIKAAPFLLFAFSGLAANCVFAQASPNPIADSVRGLELLGSILSGDTRIHYSAVDQQTFNVLSRDLIAAASPKNFAPITPLSAGQWSFTIAAENNVLNHQRLWRDSIGITDSSFQMPSIAASYGVTERLSVFARYMEFSHGARLLGGGLAIHIKSIKQWDITGSTSVSQVTSDSALSVRAASFDGVASYPLGNWRGYLGLGQVFGRASLNEPSLTPSSDRLNKYFVGTEYRLGSFSMGAEFGNVGDQFYQGLKISYVFR